MFKLIMGYWIDGIEGVARAQQLWENAYGQLSDAAIARKLKTYYKTHCFITFGGHHWFKG